MPEAPDGPGRVVSGGATVHPRPSGAHREGHRVLEEIARRNVRVLALIPLFHTVANDAFEIGNSDLARESGGKKKDISGYTDIDSLFDFRLQVHGQTRAASAQALPRDTPIGGRAGDH